MRHFKIIALLCVLIFTTKTAQGSLILNTSSADSLESDNLLATLVLSNKSGNVPSGKYSSDGILTSIPVNIFKRSDEDARSNVDSSNTNNGDVDVPKKKPKLYSWWMPNMTMTNSGQSVSTTEISVESSTSMNSSSTRPTRKPRPTRPPRTRRPSKSTTTAKPSDSKEYTSTPVMPTTTMRDPPSSTASSKPISDRVPSSTEPSSYIDPYGVKRKLVYVAKAVGKVAVKTIGVVGSVAVGTAVKSVGSQVAPIASSAVSKAGSVALSAATQVGSYAVDAAGRALIRYAASLTNTTGNASLSGIEKSSEVHVPNSYMQSSADGSRDEGKIVTVYVKHPNYTGGQAMSEDQSRKKNHTVYHKEDRVLLMESRVQDLEEMMADSHSPPKDETHEKEVTGRVELSPPTVPAGVKKVFNKKSDSKISNTVCRNKPGILITAMNSLVLGVLTTILKDVKL